MIGQSGLANGQLIKASGGMLYLVMDYVQGNDVAQMIRASDKLPPEHAFAIIANVREALA